MRNYLIYILLSTVVSINGFAQQQNLNGHYYFNPYAINNVWAGYEGKVDASLSYRQSWAGFDNAPASYFGTVHIPLEVYITKSYPQPILGLALQDTLSKLKPEKIRNDDYGKFVEGAGLSIVSHTQNTISTNNVSLSYAMHSIPKDYTSNSYSIGFGIGITNFRTDLSDVRFSNPETAIAENSFSYIKPNIEFGIIYSIEKWSFMRHGYIGYSVKQGLNNRLDFGLSGKPSLRLHHYFTTGRIIVLNEKFQLMPTFICRLVKGVPNIFEINSQLVYLGIINAGVGARTNGDITTNFGLMLKGSLALNYSFDILNSGINQVASANHQISIGYSVDR